MKASCAYVYCMRGPARNGRKQSATRKAPKPNLAPRPRNGSACQSSRMRATPVLLSVRRTPPCGVVSVAIALGPSGRDSRKTADADVFERIVPDFHSLQQLVAPLSLRLRPLGSLRPVLTQAVGNFCKAIRIR